MGYVLIHPKDNVKVDLNDGHKYAVKDIAEGENVIKLCDDGNILLEYTYIFSFMGLPSCMKKDTAKLKARLVTKK